MQVKHIDEMAAVPVEMDGAKDVTVRVVFGPADEAPTFAMRQFDIAPGGHTPWHTHGFEHQIIVLAGELKLVGENGDRRLVVGDAAMVKADEKHQFRNASAEDVARMICLVPVEYQK